MRKVPAETIQVESGLTWTAAIMGSLAILELSGERADKLQEIRENEGIGGDSMTGGFLYLAIESAKYLERRIESYDSGVFAYEGLETCSDCLPALFIDTLPAEEWANLADGRVPQKLVEEIIDGWLEGPAFEKKRADGSLILAPREQTEYRVELRGWVEHRHVTYVKADSEEEAAEAAMASKPDEAVEWSQENDSVSRATPFTVEEYHRDTEEE